MSSHNLRLSRRVLVPLCLFTLGVPALSSSTIATTRLSPTAAPARVQAPSTPRRSGAPVGVRLTAGARGERYGAGLLSGDPLASFGSVVRIDATGEVYSIHDFNGVDGARPIGTVAYSSDGFIYGATSEGGAAQAGSVYRVRPDGTGFSTVYTFTGLDDGGRPSAGLTATRSGAIVGTTSQGGPSRRGVVFQVDVAGTYKVLHGFAPGEGASPAAAVTEGAAGVLYGTTRLGGANDVGTVFAMKATGGDFRTVHVFAGADGMAPQSELVIGSDGLLYGTASQGGNFDNGTLFRFAQDGTRFQLVRAFDASQAVNSRLGDKSRPSALAVGPDGRVYGTTVASQNNGRGQVFVVRPDTLAYSAVYAFGPGDPRGGLVTSTDGNLYIPVYDVSAGPSLAVLRLQPFNGRSLKASTSLVADESFELAPAEKTATPNGVIVACANPWAAAASYPANIGRYGFAQVGEDLYVFAGVSDGLILPNSRRYNTGTDTWTDLADDPIPGEHPAATEEGGKIYITQGSGGTGFAIYDIAGNTWTTGPAIPGPTNRYGGCAGSFNGNVFVVGGGNTASTDVQVYNIAGNTWSAGTAAPSPYQVGGYVQIDQFLYCVGSYGATAAANSNVTMRLDMSSAPGVWTVGPTWTPARADLGLSSQAGKLVASGGDTNAGGFFDASATVDELDVSAWPAGTWVSSPPDLPSNRQGNQAGFLSTTGRAGGEIWSTGGIFGRQVHTFINEHLYRPFGADVTPPEITCPGDITAGENPMGSGQAVVTFDVTATDNCSTPTVTCTPPSGSTFLLGSTKVICDALDASQNQSSCFFNVTVVNSTFTNCCVDDATGNVLAIDADPASPNRGAWQLTIAAGGTLSGVAEQVSYIPGHSLIASDRDSPNVSMQMNINFGAGTCVALVTDLVTGTQYVIRDRNINNNPPCAAAPPPPPQRRRR